MAGNWVLAAFLALSVFVGSAAAVGGVFAQNGALNATGNLYVGPAGSVLFVNSTNGSVGIGTASPARPLHISATQDANIRLQDSSGAGPAAYVEFYNDTTRWGYVGLGGHDDWMSIGTTAEKDLAFYTNNSPKMVLTAAGNVGVGTTNPQAVLHVNASSAVTDLLLSRTSLPNLQFQDQGTPSLGQIYYDSGRLLHIGTPGGADAITLNLSSGNVGIGASSISKLEVAALNSSVAIGGSLGSPAASQTGIQFLNYGVYHVGLRYDGQGNLIYESAGNSANPMLWYNGQPANFLVRNGNVGIGTTSPVQKLDVNGNVNITGTIYGGTSCPSDMAYVPGQRPFCIDKYEAYLASGTVSNGACSSGSQAEVDAGATTAVAGSAAGQTPLVSLNWCAAKKACQNAGKHLCSNEEWFKAANYKGSKWSLTGEETSETMSCNTASECGGAACLTGASPGCVTQEGAYDMIGNVWEWVDQVVTSDPTNGVASGYVTGYDFATGLPTSIGSSANAYGNDYFWAYDGAGAARAFFRGGRWGDGASDGAFALDLNYAPSDVRASIGFRCCK